MYRLAILPLTCLLLCFPVMSQADAPVPDDFAYGAPLTNTGQSALYQTFVPPSVYRRITKPDLADLRIFNGQQQVVAHLLQPAEPEVIQQTRKIPLKIFPIYQNSLPAHSDNISVLVKRDQNGSIIDVGMTDPQEPTADNPVTFYLIDCAPAEDAPLSGLELDWQADSKDFYRQMEVESSNDLISWRYIATAAIASLHHQGLSFSNHDITLDNRNYRYLRLKPADSGTGNILHAVKGLQKNSASSYSHSKQSLTVYPVRSSKNIEHLYDLGGHFPVDRINIRLQTQNTMTEARLLSGNDPNGPMNEVWRGRLYFLLKESTSFRNSEIELSSQRHRYWKIIFDKSETVPAPPQLQFNYYPDKIIFLGSGDGPFMLAYGNPAITAPEFTLKGLLAQYQTDTGNKINALQLSVQDEIILGGPDRLNPPAPPLPWKKYLLWMVLCSGTLVVARMSLNLYKDLTQNS